MELIWEKKNPFFTWKLISIDKKIISESEIRNILIGMKQIFPMKPSEFKIFISVESYDKKNCWKLPKFQQFRKSHSFQTLIAQIEDLKNECVEI